MYTLNFLKKILGVGQIPSFSNLCPSAGVENKFVTPMMLKLVAYIRIGNVISVIHAFTGKLERNRPIGRCGSE
jgi:hypothetical protein